jgi:hypothetical protein
MEILSCKSVHKNYNIVTYLMKEKYILFHNIMK